MHPSLLALPEHERPKEGESATDYWQRLRAEAPERSYGPRLFRSPREMTDWQHRQWRLRKDAGMTPDEATAAVYLMDDPLARIRP